VIRATLTTQDPDVRQVPVVVVVVEPVSDHELVGDREAAVVRLDRNFLATDLAEQDRRADAPRTPILHPLDERGEGVAGVEDVVEQEHVAPRDLGGERLVDHQRPGAGRGPLVAARLQERHAEGQLDPANQVGEEDQAAGEDSHDRERLARVIRLDLATERDDSVADLVLGNQNLHGVVSG